MNPNLIESISDAIEKYQSRNLYVEMDNKMKRISSSREFAKIIINTILSPNEFSQERKVV